MRDWQALIRMHFKYAAYELGLLHDPLLKGRFQKTNSQMREMIGFTIDGGIANGSMQPMTKAVRESLIDAFGSSPCSG